MTTTYQPRRFGARPRATAFIDGPFTNFTGVVEEVNLDRNTLKAVGQTVLELLYTEI